VTARHEQQLAEMFAASERRWSPRVGIAGGVRWLSDLVRLEIVLWERVDGRLRAEHDLPLAFFETLWFLAESPSSALRVGELASALQISQGGTSKLADRIARAGLIRREPDPLDGRVSRLRLTSKGKRVEAAARQTYEAELKAALGALNAQERRTMHRLVSRLLDALVDDE
jgi:MarR family transcriptional regulator, organic hydroperoxide resistance regulator